MIFSDLYYYLLQHLCNLNLTISAF